MTLGLISFLFNDKIHKASLCSSWISELCHSYLRDRKVVHRSLLIWNGCRSPANWLRSSNDLRAREGKAVCVWSPSIADILFPKQIERGVWPIPQTSDKVTVKASASSNLAFESEKTDGARLGESGRCGTRGPISVTVSPNCPYAQWLYSFICEARQQSGECVLSSKCPHKRAVLDDSPARKLLTYNPEVFQDKVIIRQACWWDDESFLVSQSQNFSGTLWDIWIPRYADIGSFTWLCIAFTVPIVWSFTKSTKFWNK